MENAFGIMANRFRVLINPICLQPAKVDVIVEACCSLHNMLRTILPSRYNIGDENSKDAPQPTTIAASPSTGTMQPARVSGRRSATQSAKKHRDTLCKYFNSDQGSVEWQDQMI